MCDDVSRDCGIRAASDILRDYKLRRYLENRDKYEHNGERELSEPHSKEKEKEDKWQS